MISKEKVNPEEAEKDTLEIGSTETLRLRSVWYLLDDF